MDLGIAGKAALITGASQGIGYACALALAREGVRVGMVARNEAILKQAAEAITRQTGTATLPIAGDAATAERAAAAVEAAFGSLDILVNNASPRLWGLAFHEVMDADWLLFWQHKVIGYARFARACAPRMAKHRWGRVINLAGMGGRNPSMRALPGGMAQTAVLNMTKAISDEYGVEGITVNAISPGAIDNGAQENAGPKGPIYRVMANEQRVSEEQAKAQFLSGISLRRLGSDEEVADLVLFLASNRAAYITGTNITIDGGRSKSIV